MFSRLKVRTQLLILSCVSLVLFVVALLVTVFALQSSQSRLNEFIQRDSVRLAAFNAMYAQGLQSGQALRNIMLDPANRRAYDNLDKALADFDAALRQAKESSVGRADILTTLSKLEEMAKQQQKARAAVITDVAANRLEEAMARLNKEETPIWRKLKDELLNAIAVLSSETEQIEKQMSEESARRLRMIVAIAVLAILSMLVISATIARNLLRQLGGGPAAVVTFAQRIAGGDLTQSIAVATNDKTSLMAAFTQMQSGLRAMIRDTRQTTEAIASAAQEMATAGAQV